jgi:hypothetical protein
MQSKIIAKRHRHGPIPLATVRDPDGVLVLLTLGSITRRR